MTIKEIFDEISAEPGTNRKMEILRNYSGNTTLKNVLYLANSPRIKFYIKQLPQYVKEDVLMLTLEEAIEKLSTLYKRELTGNKAIEFLQNTLKELSSDDAYIIERIIDKDCKIGMGTTNMNKVFPSLIEKTPYMGASSFDEKKVRALLEKGPCYSQIKMDGRYANAIIRNGEVELVSRDGEPTLLENPAFLEPLTLLPDCVLNGELTIPGISRYSSNGIIASCISIAKKRSEGKDVSKEIKKMEVKHGVVYEDALARIVLTVWDTITVDEYYDNRSETPYEDRLIVVRSLLDLIKSDNVRLIEGKVVTTYTEAIAHFKEVLELGEEGTILKLVLGTWKDGKPTWQFKFKLEMDVDLKIVGFNYGTKGTKNENVISSLNAQSECGKVVTKPQGLNEEMMKYVTENQEQLLGTIVECKSCGLSNDSKGNYSLLHPVFSKLRDDKTVADTLEGIIAIENMVKGLN